MTPIKAMVSGTIGAVTSSAGYLSADFLTGTLKLVCLIVFTLSSLIALWSAFFVLLINRRRNRVEAIKEVQRMLSLCAECRKGKVPVICPISPFARPTDCPHQMQRERRSWFNKILQWIKTLLNEEKK